MIFSLSIRTDICYRKAEARPRVYQHKGVQTDLTLEDLKDIEIINGRTAVILKGMPVKKTKNNSPEKDISGDADVGYDSDSTLVETQPESPKMVEMIRNFRDGESSPEETQKKEPTQSLRTTRAPRNQGVQRFPTYKKRKKEAQQSLRIDTNVGRAQFQTQGWKKYVSMPWNRIPA